MYMLPWKHHAHQVLINLNSQSITVVFLKAMLNIAGTCTCFVMVQYNAEMCIVSGFAWKLGFSQAHGTAR